MQAMANYVLIHGAGSDSWYWHLVAPKLEALGHTVITPNLPCDDDAAGLPEYLDAVLDNVGDRSELIVVAQSMGGFTAPLLCDRVSVRLLVLAAAMVPRPGESPGEWWSNTEHERAKREQDARDGRPSDGDFDPIEIFLHDVPSEVVAQSAAHVKNQSGTPFVATWPLAAWPDVPTRFLLCRDDRLFPADFMRRMVKERLGILPDEMRSGHLPALSHPDELVERLETYRLAL
ncbi:MAG TPA: alpha/beta hydrolase [Acidimicrobiales bacterium]|jgi:pimeloyl-ACP methyl ester carboxylesterase|nr:alpha/beta hydrolase [Acidimicrobiales bacterium]